VLRVLAKHEGQAPADPAVIADLKQVQDETSTRINLARTGNRNLIRNSGQYWKGTGLLKPIDGEIKLTGFGREVAKGDVSRDEFAALMIAHTALPGLAPYSPAERLAWMQAGLEIRPLQLILQVLQALERTSDESYLTNDELVRVVIPLAGVKSKHTAIAEALTQHRAGSLTLAGWPDCAPSANDRRMTVQLLRFLAHFGVLRTAAGGTRDEQRYWLESDLGSDLITTKPTKSLFADDQAATAAVDEIRQSELPSMVERERRLVSMLSRPRQGAFRKAVLSAQGCKCVISGEIMGEVLEAAHIRPVKHKGGDEAANGLCLRVDLHRLYDAGHLRIRSNGQIVLSEAAKGSVTYSALPGSIQLPNGVNHANVRWRDEYL